MPKYLPWAAVPWALAAGVISVPLREAAVYMGLPNSWVLGAAAFFAAYAVLLTLHWLWIQTRSRQDSS